MHSAPIPSADDELGSATTSHLPSYVAFSEYPQNSFENSRILLQRYNCGVATKAALYPIWALVIEIRERANMTQAELAAASGVPQSSISRYERAKQLPDIPTLVSLAEGAGLELTFGLHEDKQRRSGRRRTFAEAIAANEQAVAAANHIRASFVGDPRSGQTWVDDD